VRVPNADYQTRISPDPETGETTGPLAPDATGWSDIEMEEEQR
jgi:hypothetical protein